MGFLSDFLYYNTGNECPRQFWQWSALTLLGHVLAPKVVYPHGDGKFNIYTPLYTGLIGDAGSGKSTAKDEIQNIVTDYFPQYLVSDSIQSREDIIKKMATPECLLTWTNHDGTIKEYRPFFIIANEFKNFLSVNPIGMVAFLEDVHAQLRISTGFKNVASQKIINPVVSMLSCGVPDWLMTELKMSLFSGGLGRRLILVVGESGEPCPKPSPPKDWAKAKARCVAHLKACYDTHGIFSMSPNADKWWVEWYVKHKKNRPDDPILGQFHSTKHVMVLKVAMLVAMDTQPFLYTLTDDHLQVAVAMLNELEKPICQLTSGIGRNELASYGNLLLQRLEGFGGMATEKRMNLIMSSHLQDREYQEVKAVLVRTDRLHEFELGGKRVLMTPEAYSKESARRNGSPSGS